MNQNEMIAGYVGTDPVQRLYMGTELVWPLGPAPTPPPYEEQYFTVEAVSAGTFNISRPTGLYYSLNGGAWTAATASMNLSSGDKVRFKGDEGDIVPGQMFTGNTMDFKVYGNIMSLGYPDDFSTSSLIPESGYFNTMFRGSTGLIDASNLILPTGVTDSCYSQMFMGCTSLVYAPELPAETLSNFCYFAMFYGCTSLIYIKCLATDISATNCTLNWVSGITTDGVFMQVSGTSWSYDVNGIPETWVGAYAPEHNTGVWLGVYDWANLESYEVSGSTSGNTYVWDYIPDTESKNYSLFVDGNIIPMEIQVCGYACDECPDQGGICGGEGGENETGYTECMVYTGITGFFSSQYSPLYAVYTPGDNPSFYMRTCTAPGCEPEVDCANDWENLGYESYEDCMCQQYSECGQVDCSDWENMGYSSYEECDCAENGNCPEEVDCSDWENLGYESEDDCWCQNFGLDMNGDPCGEPEEEGGEE